MLFRPCDDDREHEKEVLEDRVGERRAEQEEPRNHDRYWGVEKGRGGVLDLRDVEEDQSQTRSTTTTMKRTNSRTRN